MCREREREVKHPPTRAPLTREDASIGPEVVRRLQLDDASEVVVGVVALGNKAVRVDDQLQPVEALGHTRDVYPLAVQVTPIQIPTVGGDPLITTETAVPETRVGVQK